MKTLCAFGIAFGLLIAGAHAQNRVLELGGNDSYVELPPGIFDGLT